MTSPPDPPEIERLKLAVTNTLRSLGYELFSGELIVRHQLGSLKEYTRLSFSEKEE